MIRAEPGVLITETKGGWICANAGIDSSNLPEPGWVALLPEDADASARRDQSRAPRGLGRRPGRRHRRQLRTSLEARVRPRSRSAAPGWPPSTTGAGEPTATAARWPRRRSPIADEVAGAADLVRDKDSGVPGAIVSGLGSSSPPRTGPAPRAQQRPAGEDLFR